jgi:hypothetical protein
MSKNRVLRITFGLKIWGSQFVLCSKYSGNQNKDETDGTCSIPVEVRNAYKIRVQNLQGKDHLTDLGVDESIQFRLVIRKQGGNVRIGFISFRIWTNGGFLWTRQRTFGLQKKGEFLGQLNGYQLLKKKNCLIGLVTFMTSWDYDCTFLNPLARRMLTVKKQTTPAIYTAT